MRIGGERWTRSYPQDQKPNREAIDMNFIPEPETIGNPIKKKRRRKRRSELSEQAKRTRNIANKRRLRRRAAERLAASNKGMTDEA
jgi:hypothetical protein